MAVFLHLLWRRPYYQAFPLILAGAGYLAWDRTRRLGPLVPGARKDGRWLVGFVWLLLAGACLLQSPWLAYVSALLTVLAVAWGLGGRRLLKAVVPAVLLAAVVLPPPLNLDERLINRLQLITARESSVALGWLGVPHFREGGVLELLGGRLAVEESCAGINSLVAILAAALFWSLWRRRPAWHTALLFAAAGAAVLLANVTRVTLVAWLRESHGLDLTTGWEHDALGVVMFLVCAGLLLSTDQFLLVFSGPLLTPRSCEMGKAILQDLATTGLRTKHVLARLVPPGTARPGMAGAATSLPDLGTPWFAARSVVVVGGALFAAQLALWLIPRSGEPLRPRSPAALAARPLPDQLGGWQLDSDGPQVQDRGSSFAPYSVIWRYRRGDLWASVQVDYLFAGWHELTLCYRVDGWQQDDRAVRGGELLKGEPAPWVEVRMARPLGASGFLCFSLVDEHGKWLLPPDGLVGALRGRLPGWNRQPDASAYQIQVFVESAAPLSASERDEVSEFYRLTRAALLDLLASVREDGQ